ncbi:12762_t:CDS:2 [Ambispora gerdemannii]|uniref:12762_t:CDS:1 n=1 Tax=Ambispora gerdemannii TaxID=144530 RepID=A0A9N9CYU8_9GLOM|nr:12762_t:CDS:2 [Ambispora gerdemannii]
MTTTFKQLFVVALILTLFASSDALPGYAYPSWPSGNNQIANSCNQFAASGATGGPGFINTGNSLSGWGVGGNAL